MAIDLVPGRTCCSTGFLFPFYVASPSAQISGQKLSIYGIDGILQFSIMPHCVLAFFNLQIRIQHIKIRLVHVKHCTVAPRFRELRFAYSEKRRTCPLPEVLLNSCFQETKLTRIWYKLELVYNGIRYVYIHNQSLISIFVMVSSKTLFLYR